MPASDLSGHDDGPDRLVASLPVSPSNRFAKPSGGVPIARCGWDVRPVPSRPCPAIGCGSRPYCSRWTTASLRQIHRRSIATLIDFSVSDGGCGGCDRWKMESARDEVLTVAGRSASRQRRFNGTLNQRRRANNREAVFAASSPIITPSGVWLASQWVRMWRHGYRTALITFYWQRFVR